jgi:hypothetical protein
LLEDLKHLKNILVFIGYSFDLISDQNLSFLDLLHTTFTLILIAVFDLLANIEKSQEEVQLSTDILNSLLWSHFVTKAKDALVGIGVPFQLGSALAFVNRTSELLVDILNTLNTSVIYISVLLSLLSETVGKSVAKLRLFKFRAKLARNGKLGHVEVQMVID